ASLSEVKNLLEELKEICAALVVHERINDQPDPETGLLHANAELNVFGVPVEPESLRYFKHPARYAHVKAARLKPSHAMLPSTYTARCKKRGHRVRHRTLSDRKLLMRLVRPSPRIQAFRGQRLIDRCKIGGRQDAVTIENNKVITLC